MGNRAKSQEERSILKRREIDTLYARAKEVYIQRNNPSCEGSRDRGFRAICKAISDGHFAETGRRVHLSSSTLQRHVLGGRSKSKANSEKGWLTEEESELLITYSIDMAERGFPLKLKELQRHAEDILRARLGDKFPTSGVGKHWVGRFVSKHSDRLQKYLSRGLDKKRAKNVNPTIHEAWFTLLAKTINDLGIETDCTYGSDEVGFWLRALTRCQVIGPVDQKILYDCAPENRENATVLCTICGDGSSLPPLVIFKGRYYFASWSKVNKGNFMIGRSVNGWITGEIGVAWIKQFDRLTRQKANGRARLLLVDGHSSHYTVQFLQHARANNIHVLCYPSHTTHVYQGLDVAIFSPLKLYYQEELRNFERLGGGRVTKEVFITLYSNAHAKAFVAENIRVAWAKTGVIPLNPNAIRAKVFRTSLETTTRTGTLPLSHIQSTPTRVVIQLLNDARKSALEAAQMPTDSEHIENAVEELKRSDLGFLLGNDVLTVRARSRLPTPELPPATPGPIDKLELIRSMSPRTDSERVLRDVLDSMADKVLDQGRRINTLQATMVLHEAYVNKLQGQLNRKEKKTTSRARLLGDGLPVLLSGEEFYQRAKQHQQKREAEERRKILAVQTRRIRAEEVKQWKKSEDDRKERNKVARTAYQARLKDWERRRAAAKSSKLRFTENKPLRGLLERPEPKPGSLKSEQTANSSGIINDLGEYFDLQEVGSEDDDDENDDWDLALSESTYRVDNTLTAQTGALASQSLLSNYSCKDQSFLTHLPV